MTRRELLSGATVAAAASLIELTPAKTSLDAPQKPTALTDRGQPDVYQNDDLKFIGMPVGGCFAGTVYLGGNGQLWNWDIFNVGQLGTVSRPDLVYLGDHLNPIGGANYVEPPYQSSPFYQRFDLSTDQGVVKFGEISFRGEYPIGRVAYRRGDADLEMDLEAFSPFVPLDIDSSSYPATTLTFKVKNVGKQTVPCRLQYEFENPVLCLSKKTRTDFDPVVEPRPNGLVVAAKPHLTVVSKRDDRLFEDWSSGTYGGWKATGTAFGSTPRKVSDLPSYMGAIDAGTTYVVNTHNNRQGEDVVQADTHVGTLTSPVFTLERDYLNFRIGGGNHPNGTCVNLLVNGKITRTLTGDNSNRMVWKSMSVKEFAGSTAQIQIVDNVTGGWGQIAVGEIVQCDSPRDGKPLDALGDFGAFGVEFLGSPAKAELKGQNHLVHTDFELKPGEEKSVSLLVAWRFPNKPGYAPGKQHWYSTKWSTVHAVLDDLKKNWPDLQAKTRLWNKTWYDSTLPYWFLDRTFVNLSTLATTTCFRLDSEGRFYFSEGVGCCPGTCTHVWGYAQATARIFPEVERYLREKIDFGEFLHPDGAIDYRGEYGRSVATDGQLSCVLRFYREHLMSKDDQFLKRNWPNVKRAVEFMIEQDKNRDGILEGAQYNTLDAAWFGPISWISSLYIACLRATEKMATLVGDSTFAQTCKTLAESGSKFLVENLYNGEYFINHPDPAHPEANNTNIGCHIDQLYGQFWTSQLGLPRVVPAKEGKKAMASLYKYSFYRDIWDYRRRVRAIHGGRWYAMPGEGGLIMCTFPKGGAENAAGKGQDAWAAGYFNECMSGFEYQAAANMIAEGLVQEGLTVVKAIHDRYHASKRNPFNEVECSDHYGRAMASFGAYLAYTGMQIDSPNHKVEITPLTPNKRVRCAFVDAHGWGTIDNTSGKTIRNYIYKA